MPKSPPDVADSANDVLPDQEIGDRERRVLEHFLTSKPAPHKPKGGKSERAQSRKKKPASST